MFVKVDSIKNKQLKRLVEHIVYLIIILVLIPAFLFFEICIALPTVTEQWSIPYFIHLFNACFLIVNIVGNLVYGAFTNTSMRGKDFSTFNKEDWTFCSVCEYVRPPRAWHCDMCGVCILKRDHHCTYLACCVGYYNQRYFMLFTLHVFIAMVYAFVINVKFISQFVSWRQALTAVKFLFPLVAILIDFGEGSILTSLYVFVLVVNTVIALFTGFLFFYHSNNILKGKTTPEMKHSPKFIYDKGWKNNLIECFGSRWYLTWFCPFSSSPLPGNGIEWTTNDKYKII